MNDIWPLIVSKLDNAEFEAISRTPLWLDIVPAIRSDTFWFSRVEHLVRCALINRSENTAWKDAFYELSSVLRDESCPFFRLACPIHERERPGTVLAAQTLLQIGRIPSEVYNTLVIACQSKKADLTRTLLEGLDKTVVVASVITDLIRSVTLLGLPECLGVLLARASASDVNRGLDSGLPFRHRMAGPFVSHPLCEPTERMFEFAMMHSNSVCMHLLVEDRRFDLKCTTAHLSFASFLSTYRQQHLDRVSGCEFGMQITKTEEVPNDSYDALLRMLIVQNRTTSECIEYMREDTDLEELVPGFSRLLEPEMTLARLAGAGSNSLLIIVACTHLGMQRLREEGVDQSALLH